MKKLIRHSPDAYKRIKDTSKTLDRIDFASVAEELGVDEAQLVLRSPKHEKGD